MNNLQIIILSAGQGTRMKSDTPKILHPLGGRPVLHYVLDLAQQMTPQQVVLVVSPSQKDIKTPFVHQTVVQHPAQGTGDAVKYALPYLKAEGHVLVLYGDTPLIRQETLENMINMSQTHPERAVIVLGMRPMDKQNYARLILNEAGELEEIIEDRDATPSQKEIPLCNSGVMLVRGDLLESFLSALTPQNAAQEYYLTDLVKIARQKGYTCGALEGEASEFMGINTRQDLALAEAFLQDKWRNKAMSEGITLIDPKTTYFSYDTKLAPDVTLHPCVVLGVGVEIEKGAEIFPFCRLSESYIGPYALVGPFAHLRGGVHLQEKAEIGNFVEVKKSTFGPKAKAKHLSYIGDADIGPQANIGAGTITCNYDGFTKFKTKIGEGAFVGSNSSLIAPLSIGDYAIVGAGSVVTQNVKSRALAVVRGNQTTLDKGADKFREKRKKRRDL
ncbi:MAG TPA: bifunctional UDP-N-acetylglucosamine diphosphorylase/glucosamine-1-phosphate N-acetyltransferase GlmU [Alphaproteobacteria bacterium]|nr:bifunctional UDP-N-acetylglucosamine diphosphorylase/glucosamine-1-phosphate N-acetyltransferase GlmU [Alphaproteobacteria bacterium]